MKDWALGISIGLNVILLIVYFSYRGGQEEEKDIIFTTERANYVGFRMHVYDVLEGRNPAMIRALMEDCKLDPEKSLEDRENLLTRDHYMELIKKGKIKEGP